MLILPISLLVCFIAAALGPYIARLFGSRSRWLLAAAPCVLFLFFFAECLTSSPASARVYRFEWLPQLGLHFSLALDGLGLLFALLITGIGSLVIVYAGSYLEGHEDLPRLYAALFAFMGAMLGVVLSDNLLLLFIFWELTSVTSYILIGFNHTSAASRTAALQALLTTGSGGLLLLFAFLIIGSVAGTLELSELAARSEVITASPLLPLIIVLVAIGAFTKSAQFPFHYWLPNAMEAPTPVSAYLHSATMVKAGVYLIARFAGILGDEPLWQQLVVTTGLITMVSAAYMALTQKEFKKVLAYTTISSLGVITFLLGLNTPLALQAALTFLLAHALYKGALFMIAGIIDHEAGEKDISKVGGLRPLMPVTCGIATLASLSMLGAPPFFGFVAKEIFYEAALKFPNAFGMAIVICVLTTAFLVCAGVLVGLKPFWGAAHSYAKVPHDPPLGLWIGPGVLSVAGLLLGVLTSWSSTALIDPALRAVNRGEGYKTLALWHGFGTVLILSLATLFAGVLLASFWQRIFGSTLAKAVTKKGPEDVYFLLLRFLVVVAETQTRFFQSGYLRNYLLILVGVTSVLLGYHLLPDLSLELFLGPDPRVLTYDMFFVLLSLIAVYVIIRSRSKLSAVIALGLAGYVVAIIFMMFAAPDLAMTQVTIDTLSVVFFVFVLTRLPSFTHISRKWIALRDVVVSGVFGLSMTALLLRIAKEPLESKLAPYFAENSYLLAHGKNVVNVILVDFRALDTLGEVTVLTIAALGVYGLIKFRSDNETEGGQS